MNVSELNQINIGADEGEVGAGQIKGAKNTGFGGFPKKIADNPNWKRTAGVVLFVAGASGTVAGAVFSIKFGIGAMVGALAGLVGTAAAPFVLVGMGALCIASIIAGVVLLIRSNNSNDMSNLHQNVNKGGVDGNFLSEINKNGEVEVITENRKADIIWRKLNNNGSLEKAGKMNLNIVACNYIKNADEKKSSVAGQAFRVIEGGTSDVIKKLHKDNPGENIAGMIYADATNCGGYFNDADTQEEMIFRDMGPDIPCHLLNKGLISKGKANGHNVLPYNDIPTFISKKEKNELSLSPAVGFAIDAKLLYDGQKKLQEPIPFRALFCAMPSLSGAKENFDVNGAAFRRCRMEYEYLKSKNEKPDVNEVCNKSKGFVEKLYQKRTDPNDEVGKMNWFEFRRALIICMCSEECSVHYNNQGEDAAMGKLIRCVKAGDNNEVFKRAEENYKKMLHETIRSWIITARESGAKYFVGGPIGCGAFYNDAKLVAQIFAEEFRDYGGDMQFVYPKFKKEDANCNAFKKAFDEAFKKAS